MFPVLIWAHFLVFVILCRQPGQFWGLRSTLKSTVAQSHNSLVPWYGHALDSTWRAEGRLGYRVEWSLVLGEPSLEKTVGLWLMNWGSEDFSKVESQKQVKVTDEKFK